MSIRHFIRFKFLEISILCLAFSLLAAPQSHAVWNGIEQPDNKWTVALTIESGKRVLLCSGVLVDSTTVITARHCVTDEKGNPVSKITISSPGSKFAFPQSADVEQKVVVRVTLGQIDSKAQAQDQSDIAVLTIATPFRTFELPELATTDQLGTLKPWSIIKGYGYGTTGESNTAYSPIVRQYDLSWGNDDHTRQDNVILIASASSIGCSGDSGGPITAFLSETHEVLIGIAASIVNQGSNGCAQRDLNQLYYENFNLIYPYLDLISKSKLQPITAIKKPTKIAKKLTKIKKKP